MLERSYQSGWAIGCVPLQMLFMCGCNVSDGVEGFWCLIMQGKAMYVHRATCSTSCYRMKVAAGWVTHQRVRLPFCLPAQTNWNCKYFMQCGTRGECSSLLTVEWHACHAESWTFWLLLQENMLVSLSSYLWHFLILIFFKKICLLIVVLVEERNKFVPSVLANLWVVFSLPCPGDFQ